MLKSLLSIALSLLLAATPLYAAPPDNQIAGSVKALIPDASRNAQPVKLNDSVAWNDLLKTDAQGRLRAGLTSGSILSLGSNSQLQVVQHDAVSQQTLVVVDYGKLRSQVERITRPGGKYQVKTPNAVIGVVGTDFYVGYANSQTTVICYVGKVAVTPGSGVKVIKNENAQKDSNNNNLLVAAGEMVIIGLEMPAGGYQVVATPTEVAEASLQDTYVPDQPVRAHTHTWRKVFITTGLLGLGLGLGIAQRGGSSGNGNGSTGSGTGTGTGGTPTETINFNNEFGTVNVTSAGIVSKGSELQGYNGVVAPPERSLGSVNFSAGAFSAANILTGGTFSNTGSIFSVISGAANYGQPPKGTIFSGSFVGPLNWTLVSQTGKYTDNFTLSGAFSGMYSGSTVTGSMTQNITLHTNQWTQDHEATLNLGTGQLNVPDTAKIGLARIKMGSGAARGRRRRALFSWSFVF